MENKKYNISKDELNALLFMYYGVLKCIDTKKGLAFKSAFDFKKSLITIMHEMKDKNINDYISIEGC